MIDILIAEDEPAIARLIELHLDKAGFSSLICPDGNEAIQLLQNRTFRLLVLDRMLPGKRGMDILRWLRKQEEISTMPVLMVTALGSIEEKVRGLEEGADDYLPKPFEPAEMVARVQALLRRVRTSTEPSVHAEDGILLDEDAMEVTVNGELLDLRPLEFKLLQELMQKQNKVRSREYLLDHVWGINSFVELRTVDVTVKRLRKALDSYGLAEVIKTVRGSGYRYSAIGKKKQ
ncbi:MAG: response regulator [Mariprofundaceae bacterium]